MAKCRPDVRRLARIALESYQDGWLDEGASASEMEERGRSAGTPEERRAFERIAGDERRHADLGRDVVLWCFGEDPRGVGRALARAQSGYATGMGHQRSQEGLVARHTTPTVCGLAGPPVGAS